MDPGGANILVVRSRSLIIPILIAGPAAPPLRLVPPSPYAPCQGSTTVVWQQQSFWNRRPASSNSVLPLYIEDSPSSSVFTVSSTAK